MLPCSIIFLNKAPGVSARFCNALITDDLTIKNKNLTPKLKYCYSIFSEDFPGSKILEKGFSLLTTGCKRIKKCGIFITEPDLFGR